MIARGDYVLGTHEEEALRLGIQHRVWRETMLGAWRRAGIQPGWRVVDVGAGPGFATMDLADLVGAAGEVLAVERSERFIALIREETRRRQLEQVRPLEADLMEAPACANAYDMTWCRWVASFVSSVPRLVQWIHQTLRPGGMAVFHEYSDYGSWQFSPARPHLAQFVAATMENWRAAGGEPNVAPALIEALGASGFGLRSVRPLVFATRPAEMIWKWPAGFVRTHSARLHELGRVSEQWGGEVERELCEAETDPVSVMVTPLVLEVIAERF
ncbi:MAG: class I SAM-dependent methyltransferase [Burkholderiales bacterium]